MSVHTCDEMIAVCKPSRTFKGMNGTYLLSVTADYLSGGSPQTLASAIQSALFEYDYSIQLREHGPESERRWHFVGLITLDPFDVDEVRLPLAEAIVDTGPDSWGLMLVEMQFTDEDVENSIVMWIDDATLDLED